MTHTKYGILGAGPSGILAGLFLKDQYQILEKELHPGGHAGSTFDRGYTFDYGPHIMFSKNKEILDFMIRSLGQNVHKSKRNNKISYKGKLIKYPFENDLKSLPLQDNFDCLYAYLYNPYKKKYRRPKNLKQWFLHHFGKGICEKYLFPYNEKVWNIPVDRLSMLWSSRIPNPPPEDIIKSALGYETEGYLHQLYYHYPLKGGYQAISESWARKVKNITYNFEIKKISTMGSRFCVTNSKQSFEFDKLISTIPIQELIKVLDITIPTSVINAVRKLIVNPMLVVSLGIKGVDKNQYTAVYFPEADFLVNRISFPKTFSPNNAPEGHYSIQAEITCRADSSVWNMSDKKIIKHVIDGLIKRNIIKDKAKIVYQRIDRIRYAYVVYDTEYEKNVTIVRQWFPKHGIHLLGRFSYFEYINVDMVIARAQEIIGALQKKIHLLNFL